MYFLLNEIITVRLKIERTVIISNKYSVPESYATTFYDVFGDQPQSLDFKNKPSAQKLLNDWSISHTNGMIKEICSTILLSTVRPLLS